MKKILVLCLIVLSVAISGYSKKKSKADKYHKKSWSYLSKKKYKKAESTLQKALKKYPKDERFYNTSISLYTEINAFQKLASTYIGLYNNVSHKPEHLKEASMVYYKNKELELSKQLMLQAFKIDSKSAFYASHLAGLYRDENMIDSSLYYISKSIVLDPKDVNNIMFRAQIYYEDGVYKTALDDFQRLLVLMPKDEEFRYMTANTYYKLKKYRKVIKLLASFKQKDPNETKFWFLLGSAYMFRGKNQKASREFKKVLKFLPDHYQTLTNNAMCIYNLGNDKKACKDWRRAYKLGSTKSKKYIKKLCR